MSTHCNEEETPVELAYDITTGRLLGQVCNGHTVYKLDRFGRVLYECVKVLTRGGRYADIPREWVRIETV